MKKKILLKCFSILLFTLFYSQNVHCKNLEIKIDTYKDFSDYLFLKNDLFTSYLVIENSLNTKLNLDFRDLNHFIYKGAEIKLIKFSENSVEYQMNYNLKNISILDINILGVYIPKDKKILITFRNFDNIPQILKSKIQNKIKLYQNKKKFELLYNYLNFKNKQKMKEEIYFDYYKKNFKISKNFKTSNNSNKFSLKLSMFFFIIVFTVFLYLGNKFRKYKF